MKRIFQGLVLVGVVMLAGCGVTSSSAGSAATNGTSSGANTTPAASTAGPIVITTDHSAYAPTDVMHVTIANHLEKAIYAPDHQASCSVLGLEMQSDGGWHDVADMPNRIAGCALGSPTRIITIAAGATYSADVMAGYLRQGDARFPAGSYRLRLAYLSTPLAAQPGAPPAPDATPTYQVLYSMTFSVNSSVPPQPVPTPPTASGTAGSATAVTGTTVVAGTAQP